MMELKFLLVLWCLPLILLVDRSSAREELLQAANKDHEGLQAAVKDHVSLALDQRKTFEIQKVDQCSSLISAAEILRVQPKQPSTEFVQLQKQVVRDSLTFLTFDEETNETDFLQLLQAGQSRVLNKAFRNRPRPRPKLSDVSCSGSLPSKCNRKDQHRSFSGICNNLENPLWGSANTAFRRFLPPDYADHISVPRGGQVASTGFHQKCEPGGEGGSFCPCYSDPKALLPAPRRISTHFHPEKNVPAPTTHLFTIFSQFVDHDVTFTPENEEDECCGKNVHNHPECFPFFAQRCDARHIPFRPGHCFPFARSLAFCDEDEAGGYSGTREQMNAITAYVDSSNIYGSSDEKAKSLRTLSNILNLRGELLEGENGLLPLLDNEDGVKEETAGDVRARENPALASVHTIFLREHNRLAKAIRTERPNFNDKRVYREVRRILGAEMQNIVYGQWLTALLGEEVMKEGGLMIHPNFDVYKPSVDASIRNSFATAAFRFGHTMVEAIIKFFHLSSTTSSAGDFKLRDSFFDTTEYTKNGGNGFQEIMLGLILQAGENQDRFVESDLTDFLFANNIGGSPSPYGGGKGSDLMARNIQRGRDHGLPSYNEFREFCHLPRVCDWDKVPDEISEENWAMLSKLYDSPADIDLWVAGIAEEALKNGGILGPTFNCLISKQFQKIKFGDRFFFTFDSNPNPFTSAQLSAIKSRRLGDLICDNTDIKKVSSNVFIKTTNLNVECGKNHNELDIDLFF